MAAKLSIRKGKNKERCGHEAPNKKATKNHFRQNSGQKSKLNNSEMKLMRSINLKNRDGFLNLLTLIIAVVIIVTLYYTKFSVHYNEPVIDKETREMMSQVGIDTSSYHSTVKAL